MKKALLILAILGSLAAVSAVAADRTPVIIGNLPAVTGAEPLPDVPYYPSLPGLVTDSPGEIVGSTQYDYQSNGSSGRRVALDSQGGVHFAWMNGTSYPSSREVDYNYVDAQGNWLMPEQGVTVSQSNGAGYVQLGLTSDNRAAVAYHQWNLADYSVLAVDAFPGSGIFEYYDVPDMLALRCYWPYIAVDRSDNFHVIVNEQVPNAGDPQAMGYTRSVDGGQTWSTLVAVDTLMTLSGIMVSSPVSDKVAIVYTHPRDFANQTHNDIYYIESADGLNWDWRNGKVNVTEYGGAETYWGYIDVAAVYDYNDHLNIVWNAFTSVNDTLYYPILLFHYSTSPGTISEITRSPDSWPDGGCSTGAWNLPICKMSLGVEGEINALHVVYTAFDTADCSAGGFANGDLYWQYSVDGGAGWSHAVNLTDSHTPGCVPGDCDSDHWSSLAEMVDGFLHIIYIDDKDAGGLPQTEGSVTDNPVLYLEYASPVGIEDEPLQPRTFNLAQNYPNPFNAKTTIQFELQTAANVKLSVFDVTGGLVDVLVDRRFDAGRQSVVWNAEDLASGTYFYRLTTAEGSQVRKMALLK